jgi:hypothetical protein
VTGLRRGRTVQVSVTAEELEQWRRSHLQLGRTAAMLRAYKRGGADMVAVEDVLDMLGQDPDVPQPASREPPRDPRADPLTGAMWPGPAGSSPPGPD